MRWTRDGDAWVSDVFRIEVVGSTSMGRPTTWALQCRGSWVEQISTRLGARTKTFDRVKDAKNYALTIYKRTKALP
jgi:hypothetical protein